MRSYPLHLPRVMNRIAEIESRFATRLENASEQRLTGRTDRAYPAPEIIRRQKTDTPGEFEGLVAEYAQRYGFETDFINRVIAAESGFNPDAVSQKGAMGLMQLMPGTARMLGVDDPFDPSQNLEGGMRYLRELVDRFGDKRLALAAYNAGPGRVDEYGGVPPFPETQNYVRKILGE